ncbi:MAG: hypothetical protein A2X56_01810 [Nitrospirae bacterium GWC2_57_13]|nr:MAG: hypothetical protein A2X56_01810 [Nitrospirae bacterium GWC2_57_13]
MSEFPDFPWKYSLLGSGCSLHFHDRTRLWTPIPGTVPVSTFSERLVVRSYQLTIIISNQSDGEEYRFLVPRGSGSAAHPLHDNVNIALCSSADLVILDCGLDSSTGLRLLRTIKMNHPGLPVIFMTDTQGEQVVLQAFTLGARYYFRKPVDRQDIRRAVDRLLKLKRIPREERFPLPLALIDGEPPAPDQPEDIPGNLLRAVRYIEKNLSDNLYLDVLAREACLSKFHFSRQFKKFLNMSPIRFINHLRIRKAKALLEHPDASISLAAQDAGFRDLSEFIRQFKKFTGTTPHKYQAALTNESKNNHS